MARLIVFEGIERCSKTSIINLLDGVYGNRLDDKSKQPPDISFENLGILYHGMHESNRKIFKLVDQTFLLDRFFLSELVYSEQFKRTSYMTIDYIEELCKDNTVIVFYMKNTYDDYIARSPKNKIKLKELQYIQMQTKFKKYISHIESNIPNILIYEIETTNRTIEQIHKQIQSILNEE